MVGHAGTSTSSTSASKWCWQDMTTPAIRNTRGDIRVPLRSLSGERPRLEPYGETGSVAQGLESVRLQPPKATYPGHNRLRSRKIKRNSVVPKF